MCEIENQLTEALAQVTPLEGDAHLFFIELQPSDSRVIPAKSLEVLSEHEKRRVRRFHFDSDRYTYFVSHYALRIILAKYLQCTAAEITFEEGEFGKPEISHPKTSLRFNLSHTDGLIAIALCDTIDCGVDVESTHKVRKLQDLAEHAFSAQEYESLIALSDEEQITRFYEYWTLKEAYIKAVGRGIGLGLGTFYFDVTQQPINIYYNESFGEKPEDWLFQQGQVSELNKHWALALKTSGADKLIKPHHVVLT
ncbi:MAG: 4'-phosphopantetheinyl transferase superfamily protein [Cellvibrionaceae bacterium]